MRTQWARRGRPATLNCTLTEPEDPNYTLEWRKDGQLIFSAYAHEAGHAAPALQGRVARAAGLGLTIHAAVEGDGGVYTCVVTAFRRLAPTAPLLATPLRLQVNVPPRIEEPTAGKVFFATHGRGLEIRCSATAVPTPEITWLRNGRIVSGTPVLALPNVTTAHQGTYSCLAANSEGRVDVSVDIRFPTRVHFDYSPENKTVVEGSSAFWNCHAVGFPDKIDYEWRREGQNVKTTHVGLRANVVKGELAIREVRREDAGHYTCHATNSFGRSVATAFLDVQYVPTVLESNPRVYTVATGTEATLSCAASANPSVTHTNWSKNGHFVATKEKDFLVIENVSQEDAGLYTCEVFNTLGRADPFEVHVIVAQRPEFILRPPPEVRVKEGQPLSLNCSGFADPPPIQYWIRNMERTSAETLVIDKASYEHNGIYECVISNAVTSIRTETKLLVENTRPQPAFNLSVSCAGETGLRIEWVKGFDGGHDQRFTVHIEDSEKEADGQKMRRAAESLDTEVVISDLAPFGKYHITVESSNKHGSTNSTTVDRHVCTTLSAPEDARLEQEKVVWEPVLGAHSYRVEMRTNGASGKQYAPLAEVLDPHWSLSSLSRTTKEMDIRVVSLRHPFPPSAPSRTISVGFQETTPDSMFAVALMCGISFFIFLAAIFVLVRHSSSKKIRRKEKIIKGGSDSPSFTAFGGCSVNTPQIVRQMYVTRNGQQHSHMLDGDWGGSAAWSAPSRDDPVMRYIEDPLPVSMRETTLNGSSHQSRSRSILQYDRDGVSIERDSVVGDMLRSKYFVVPDDANSALIDELRIARLKKEFKQSQL